MPPTICRGSLAGAGGTTAPDPTAVAGGAGREPCTSRAIRANSSLVLHEVGALKASFVGWTTRDGEVARAPYGSRQDGGVICTVTMTDKPVDESDPRLQGWYHTVELGDGLVSKGVFDHRSVVDQYGLPASLEGKEVLDVGTADGFFAFEMERRGADRVVAVDLARVGDSDWVPHMRTRLGTDADIRTWPANFRLAHNMRRSRAEHRFCSAYDLSPYTVGMFDVVFCGSLLLHLQSPLLALHAIRSVTREIAVIESAVSPGLDAKLPDQPVVSFGYPGEEEHPGEKNSYWVFSSCGFRKMVTYAGFTVVESNGPFLLPPSGPTALSLVLRPTSGGLY